MTKRLVQKSVGGDTADTVVSKPSQNNYCFSEAQAKEDL
jgi:hypothetical protein